MCAACVTHVRRRPLCLAMQTHELRKVAATSATWLVGDLAAHSCAPMSVSALDKDVATRLFKMLAVNEQTAESVKRDHAAYAKLSMLTQQAQMLQAQAINTVNKVAAKADDSVEITSTSTALSTEFDDGAKRLLKMMNVNVENDLRFVLGIGGGFALIYCLTMVVMLFFNLYTGLKLAGKKVISISAKNNQKTA